MRRWTMDELSKISDRDFLLALLNEKKEKCTNPYAPLTRRVNETIGRLEDGNYIGESGSIERSETCKR